MKVLVVMSSAVPGDAVAVCGNAARQGIIDGRSPARLINVNEYQIQRCAICNGGWGVCRTEHRCSLDDSFSELQKMFAEAEGFAWITPTVFGEPSEAMKALFDRLRRCESTKSGEKKSVLSGKPVVGIAVASDGSEDPLDCLAQMRRWSTQLGSDLFDAIALTKRTEEYQLETVHDALAGMCTYEPPKRQQLPLSAQRGKRNTKRRFKRRPPRSKSEQK